MRFFTTTLLAFSAITSFVLASPQSGNPPNPISYPSAGTQIQANVPCQIKWQPSDNNPVKLILRKGSSGNLGTVQTITDNSPNTGTYEWTPPKDLSAGNDYAIEIVDSNGSSNYSPQFGVASTGSGLPSSSIASKTASATTAETTSSTMASTTASASASASTATKKSETNTGTTSPSTTAPPANSTYAKSTLATSTTKGASSTTSKATGTTTPSTQAQSSNSASGFLSSRSPAALILCIGAAVVYLS